MTFLPIVARELRVRARWRSTFLVRTAVAVLAMAVTVVMLLIGLMSPGGFGKPMLLTLAWMAFALCVADGFRSTADCISEEKREGTLGLLFLTDLTGLDVVLGKLAATSLSSFYGLLATLPMLSLPVLLGGVTGAEFWRTVLALVNALFFSLAAGMFVSAISRHERRAWLGTAVLVGVPVILLPLAGAAGRAEFTWFSPTTPLLQAFEPGYATGGSAFFWGALLVTHLAGWFMLGLAAFLLPRLWQEDGTERLASRSQAAPPDHARRRFLLDANPVWWLTSRNEHQKRFLWAVVGITALGGTIAWLLGQGDAVVGQWLLGIAVVVHLAINIWVASESCYSFAEARSSGAMELLLCTPLDARQIVRGQQLAIKSFFLKPVCVLVAVEAVLLTAQLFVLTSQAAAFSAVMIFFVVAFSLVWFVTDLLAVSRVAMWFALTSQKPTQALTKTVLFVLVLPLVFAPCCNIIGPGLMVAKSIVFLTWAQAKLDNEFRAAAVGRLDPPRAEWWKKPEPPKLSMPA
jgi:hypothetical protein